jgi:hypothetical protein
VVRSWRSFCTGAGACGWPGPAHLHRDIDRHPHHQAWSPVRRAARASASTVTIILPRQAAAGATAAVVVRGSPHTAGLELLEVEDTLRAYGALAHARRGRSEGR